MKYRAKVDTVFKFKLVRAGQIITAGSELSKSPNFECIEGAEKVATTSNAAPARSAAEGNTCPNSVATMASVTGVPLMITS